MGKATPDLDVDHIIGERIDFLGSNQNVNLAVAAAYPIFTTGTVLYPSPTNSTYVAFCTITPNVPRPHWDSGTCTFSFDFTDWAFTQELGLYPEVPTVVYPRSNPANIEPKVYAKGVVFNFNLAVGNSLNGVCTIAAYGWAW